jgi:hypothetical protein
VGRDGSVGIATRYGLEGLGIEYSWGRDFPHPSTLALGPPIHWVPGVQWQKCGSDHPSPSSAEVKERVVLHFYSSSGPSWPVLG